MKTFYYYSDGTIGRYFDEFKILHREDGPAVIQYYDNNNKKDICWCNNGKKHKTDGPAAITYYKNRDVEYVNWFVNDEYHRLDGPAQIWYNEDKSIRFQNYWINGELYTKEAFETSPEVIEYKLNNLINQELL